MRDPAWPTPNPPKHNSSRRRRWAPAYLLSPTAQVAWRTTRVSRFGGSARRRLFWPGRRATRLWLLAPEVRGVYVWLPSAISAGRAPALASRCRTPIAGPAVGGIPTSRACALPPAPAATSTASTSARRASRPVRSPAASGPTAQQTRGRCLRQSPVDRLTAHLGEQFVGAGERTRAG